jgi:molybdopterin synthase catalytic subunit
LGEGWGEWDSSAKNPQQTDFAVASPNPKLQAPNTAMRRQLTITREPLNETSLLAQRAVSSSMGAAINFLGLVRDTEAKAAISALEYEVFEEMAKHQFNLLFDQMEKRWPIESVRLVHRVGVVKVNEPSLWVEIAAPHRAEAFAACQWLVDEMKRVVPIWKKPLASEP